MSQSTLTAISQELQKTIGDASKAVVTIVGKHHHPISGLVYAENLIMTAGHALEWNDEIRVMHPGIEPATASVAGWDSTSDLTVLKVEKIDIAPPGASKKEPEVGQLVLALARRPESGIQAGLGIIAAVEGPLRTPHGGRVERVLRTDAARGPRFSGGPLVDTEGKVMGVNIFSHQLRGAITIPTDQAWRIAQNLVEHGSNFQGYLGVRSQPVTLPEQAEKNLGRQQKNGLLVVGIESKSPADLAGLMVGDIIVGMGGSPVPDHDELLNQLSGQTVGKESEIEIVRGGQPEKLSVTVGNRSEFSRDQHGRRPCC